MCGIAGLWSQTSSRAHRIERLGRAVVALGHRGPDESAVWASDDGVGFAHTRLSIVDLSPTGRQPMKSEDGRLTITFNGEIYNHAQLRAELQALGRRFNGPSDTEVILHAYAVWGLGCADRFVGMFAFAIWDSEARQMLLCRDRVGVKPLYYYCDEKSVAFSSELKGLLALGDLEISVDRQSIGQFLQFGYISGEASVYEFVKKLHPGCWLRIDPVGRAQLVPYWRLPSTVTAISPKTEAEALDQLDEIVADAIKHRLVSDVPVSMFLSGGVDSTLVAAVSALRLGQKLPAFTVGFESFAGDETLAAQETARFLGLDHRVETVGMSELDAFLGTWADCYHEPFDDPSSFPTHILSQRVSREFKVVLSGDGGDELFGGYDGYQRVPERLRQLKSIPRIVGWPTSQVLGALAAGPLFDLRRPQTAAKLFRRGWPWLYDRVNRGASMLAIQNDSALCDRFASRWQPAEISRILGVDFKEQPGWPDGSDIVESLMVRDFHRFLPDDVMVKVDRASMAVGLEAREPLLDNRLVEFAFSLPLDMRSAGLVSKPMLRKLLARYVPEEIAYRPKKGFSVPLEKWMQHWIKNGFWDDLRRDGWRAAGDLVDPAFMEGAYVALQRGPHGGRRLWILLILQMWAKRWLSTPSYDRSHAPVTVLEA